MAATGLATFLGIFRSSRHTLPLLFLTLITLMFASIAYRRGFDWADMGSYSQIAYEMHLGATPEAFQTYYGPLWYLPGYILFWLRGVDYISLIILFQMFIFISAVLLYLAVFEATASVIAAFLVGLIFILVPPFYASVIRSISLSIFLLPMVFLAQSDRAGFTKALVWAAIAVGLNFQLRPDFGYAYLALLLVFIAVRAYYDETTNSERFSSFFWSAVTVLIVIAVTFIPLLLHAWLKGYLALLLGDLLDFPRRIFSFLMSSLGLHEIFAMASGPRGTFLKMLPVSAIFGSNGGDRAFAFLIYSTLLVMVAAGSFLFFQWARRPAERPNLIHIAVFLIVAIQWPIFAFFRPDWAHFVSFMHGYLVLAACLAIWAVPRYLHAGGRQKVAAIFILVTLVGQLALFMAHGQGPGTTGWLAIRQGRDREFTAGNGVNTRVSAAEQRNLSKIYRIIQASSKPGDRIVCVPYCAGFAFMSERRMLFKSYFVDDSTPIVFPDWIDKAIETTEAARPPVIIVLDWKIHGTDASKFDVWAARYMEFVRKNYPVMMAIQGGTVWLQHEPWPRPIATAPTVVNVIRYAPARATVGKPFNVQPDGRSALWMRLSAEVSPAAKVYLDDKALETSVDGATISAVIPPEVFNTAARHSLRVVDTEDNIVTNPVPFEVLGR